MFWKKLYFGRTFSVISADAEFVRGGKFHRKGKHWKMIAFVSEKISEDAPLAAWRKVSRQIGLAEYRVITGRIDGVAFFRFPSVAMDSTAQRGAVDFEMPRQLLKVPENYRTQFCVSGKNPDNPDEVLVNVAVFPDRVMEKLSRKMQKAGVMADEFIYPFMALDNDLDSLILPEIDSEFCYTGNSWMPFPPENVCNENSEKWLARLQKSFILPRKKDFVPRDYLMLLLAAEVLAGGKMTDSPESFRVLPDPVRPVRFRGHLIMTALLAILLIVSLVWRFTLTFGDDISEYRRILSETKRIQQRNKELKSSIKRSSKDIKEMTRLLETESGEADAVAEFALFSETLPQNVLVSSIRWNKSDIDVTVQCEDSNFDFDQLFKPLKYWKVSQQGRQNQDSAVATITLKLTPFDAEVKK